MLAGGGGGRLHALPDGDGCRRAKRAANWAPFRWVNTCLGNIKTAITATYHHVSPKHAPTYLASFAHRYDRRYQLDGSVERLAWAATRTAPQPYRVIVADV